MQNSILLESWGLMYHVQYGKQWVLGGFYILHLQQQPHQFVHDGFY